MARRLREENKAVENMAKPPLSSPDVKETSDYVFSPIMPRNRIGDSGRLLLAKLKIDRKRQYLIKHAYCDCAVNEFVYTKLAQAMDIRMPDAFLFRISEGEKRKYFVTEYILGTEYLNVKDASPAYDTIRNEALNWQDYFRYKALYGLFLESDSFEILLATDGHIYRVDTSSSFNIEDQILSGAGVNVEMNGIVLMEAAKKRYFSFDYARHQQASDFSASLDSLVARCGEECVQPYLEPFNRIQEIPSDYIEGFLDTLCYFYPDFIGDYFKMFIAAAQKAASEFLDLRHRR